MPSPTLIQKTRGTQAAQNVAAASTLVMATSQQETDCLKQSTKDQSEVLTERAIPFIDLQNHADNTSPSTDKTGFKNYFNQETLNNAFGWDSIGNAFKTFAGTTGRIKAEFLDPAWVAKIFTKDSVIEASRYVKISKNFYTFPNSIFTNVAGNNLNCPIVLPVYTAGDKLTLTFELPVQLSFGMSTPPTSGSVQIKPWIRKQVGTGTSSGKVYLTSSAPYTAYASDCGRMSLSRANLDYSIYAGNYYSYTKIFRDLTFVLDTAVDVGVTNIDFGFDTDLTGVSGITFSSPINVNLTDRTYNFDPSRIISLEIYRA